MFEFLDRIILEMFAAGESSKVIAARVSRSVPTVNAHLAECRRKAGGLSRRAMHAWIHQHPEILRPGCWPDNERVPASVRESREKR